MVQKDFGGRRRRRIAVFSLESHPLAKFDSNLDGDASRRIRISHSLFYHRNYVGRGLDRREPIGCAMCDRFGKTAKPFFAAAHRIFTQWACRRTCGNFPF